MKNRIVLPLLVLCLAPAICRAADDRTCTMRDAAMPAANTAYILCEQGRLLVTTDEGATWATRRIGDTTGLRALAFLDANRGLAAGDGGTIVATEDAGKTWTARRTGTREILADMQMVGEEGWAVGYFGIILHTADGGKTWAPQQSPVTLSLETVHFLDAKEGWAGGWSGTLLHTTDGGVTWKQIKAAGAQWSLTSIFFTDEKNGWVCGFAGQLLHTKDGGVSWETVKTPYSGWLTSVAFDSKNRGWITTDDGLLMSTDGGATWKQTGDGAVEGQRQLFLNKLLRSSGVTWALGPFGLAKQTGDGTQWKKIPNPLANDAGTP
jgi:photosystem II stability/assembly factor-like uncharacterized protein